MTGTVNGSTKKAVVRFDDGHWRGLHLAESNSLRGWYDTNHSLWIQNNSALFVRSGVDDLPVERKGALSGYYNDVLHRTASTFWVATAQGVARHTLPLWSAPVANSPDEAVNAIVEDREGRIWYTGDDALVSLDCLRMRRYRSSESRSPARCAREASWRRETGESFTSPTACLLNPWTRSRAGSSPSRILPAAAWSPSSGFRLAFRYSPWTVPARHISWRRSTEAASPKSRIWGRSPTNTGIFARCCAPLTAPSGSADRVGWGCAARGAIRFSTQRTVTPRRALSLSLSRSRAGF